MRSLIIDISTYNWIKYCAGLIMKSPHDFSVMVTCKDDIRPIYKCNDKLCKSAIYEQRKNDIFNVGKKLNIKKIYNLGHDINGIEIERLSTEITLNIMIGNMTDVYCYSDDRILNVVKAVNKQLNKNLYIFGDIKNKPDKIIKLQQDEYETKRDLNKYMIGVSSWEELIHLEDLEEFYKV